MALKLRPGWSPCRHLGLCIFGDIDVLDRAVPLTGLVRDEFDRDLVAILPRLRRYAMALCHSASLAEELVQGACLKALSGANGWNPGTRFDAWMFRILRNHWIDALRRRTTEGQPEDIDTRQDMVAPEGEAQLIERLTLREVRHAIDQLSSEQREVLVLVCVEELSYKEVAAILGVPIGTVMSRLARARRRLIDLTEPPG
jgi:RNA polymerase sigma-70 factor, ECF subfamily